MRTRNVPGPPPARAASGGDSTNARFPAIIEQLRDHVSPDADAFSRTASDTLRLFLNNTGKPRRWSKAAPGQSLPAFKTASTPGALIALLGWDDLSSQGQPDGSAYQDAVLMTEHRSCRVAEAGDPAGNDQRTHGPGLGQARLRRTREASPGSKRCGRPGGEFAVRAHVELARPRPGCRRPAPCHHRGDVEFDGRHGVDAQPCCHSAGDQHAPLAGPRRPAVLASDQRSGAFACWRECRRAGRLDLRHRVSLSTLQATGMALFGLYGSTAALATTLALTPSSAASASASSAAPIPDGVGHQRR